MFQMTKTAHIRMTSSEISELVGSRHDNVKRTIERLVVDAVIVQPPLEDGMQAANGVTQKNYVFQGEQGKRDSIVVVARLSPEFTARLVDRWMELERGTQTLQTVSSHQKQLDVVQVASVMLEMCPAAKLLALQTVCKNNDIPTNILPSYAIVTTPGADVQSSKPAHALTHLLEQHNLNITPIAVNKLLEAAGYLETKTREGKSGQEKRYKSVTQKGLAYGYNMTSPQQQRQTQPYWFDDTFTELMADVGVYPA